MKKLDPKDYTSFEAYTKALEEAKKFEERTALVSGVFQDSETDSELQENMEELGFDYCEDELCGRSYCKEHGACLSIILDEIELTANMYVFSGLLSDQDTILPKRPKGSLFPHCDDLPEAWFENGSVETQAVDKYSMITDLVSIYGDRLGMSYRDLSANRPKIREFLENLYFYLRAVLKSLPKPTVKKYQKGILQSLNRSFDTETRIRMRSEFLR